MPDTTSAAQTPPADTLAAMVGADHARQLITAGQAALHAAAVRPETVHGTADYVVATILVGALAGITRAEITGGLLEGAHAAVRDAELAAVADTLRVAYRDARNHPDNPLEALLRLADTLGVDLAHLVDTINTGGRGVARMILAAGYRQIGAPA